MSSSPCPCRRRPGTGGAAPIAERAPGRLGHLGLVALGLALYLPGLGVEILRNPLEAKYALAAREMLRGGPLLVAHLFGELYPDKPPLYFWATAALGWLAGGRIDEVIARLPAVVGALIAILAVSRLGADLFGRRAGLLAGAVLATSGLFFWYARQGHPDQFLTASVTLAALALWRGFTRETARVGWLALAYAAMALGVMSKGLLGLLIPLLGGAVYLLATGPARAAPGRLRLGLGLGVFLAVLLTWYGSAVARYGAGYLYETVVHQHVDRYTRTWAHAGPVYYYLGEFPAGFLPWVLFLPSAVVLGWRASRATGGARPAVPPPRPFLFPLSWFAAGFVFLSLSTAKRGAYLLPLYPAAALMVAWLWDHALRSKAASRWLQIPVAILTGAAAILGPGLAILPRSWIPGHMTDTLVPVDPGWLAGVALVLPGAAAAVWLLSRWGRLAVALGALVVAQGVLLLVVAAVRAPQYETRFPVRAFTREVRAAVPADQPLFSLLGEYNFIVAFYLDRSLTPLPGPSALSADGDAAPRYVLVDERDREVLDRPEARPVVETRFGPRRGTRILLVRLDPAPR